MVDSVIVGFGIVSFLLMYFSFNLDEEHYLMKTFISLFTIITISFIPFYLTKLSGVEQAIVDQYYKIYVYFIYLFFAYVIIYFVMYIFKQINDWFLKR